MRTRAYVAAGLTIGALIVLIVLQATAPPYPRDVMTCVGYMYALNQALHMYAEEGDGHFPEASRWVDALRATEWGEDIRNWQCPRDETGARCSYGMNSALSGTDLWQVPRDTVALYETAHPGDNPHGGPEDVASPPRHRNGNVYALVSFTVKQFRTPPKFRP